MTEIVEFLPYLVVNDANGLIASHLDHDMSVETQSDGPTSRHVRPTTSNAKNLVHVLTRKPLADRIHRGRRVRSVMLDRLHHDGLREYGWLIYLKITED